MADSSKSQKLKLANSRKRFKELQELRKKKNVTQGAPEISADSLTSSTQSSINADGNEDASLKLNPTPLPDYIENSAHEKSGEHVADCDTFLNNYRDGNKNIDGDNINLDNSYDNFPPSQFKSENLEEDKSHEEIGLNLKNDNFSQIVPQVIPENKYSNPNVDFGYENNKNSISTTHIYPTNKNNIENITVNENINNFFGQTGIEYGNSSIESLRQLSDHMTPYIDSEYSSFSSITDLEKRNLELTAHLEQQKITIEQQNSIINDLKIRTAQLEKELEEKLDYSNTQLVSEVRKLKEDLQCHIQTIGMLVAEKTELSANLSQFELCSKQKSAECEELKARLKTSRSRVADLEREINILRSEKQQNKTVTEGQLDLIDRLQQECNNYKDQKEEILQDMLEIKEKFRNASEENINFKQQINELTNKLSLANIRIQQISNNEGLPEGGLEGIMNEKFELEKQVSELTQALKLVTKERDESSAQYQQYAQQQNTQLISLSHKLEQLQLENENLSRQEQERIKHISELERQLQNLQTDHVKFALSKSNDPEISKEMYVELQLEKKSIEENYNDVVKEKNLLLQEVEAKNESIEELESLVEQLRGNQSDSTKLLTILESDKVAAAKAIKQNKQLKQQMESMEEVFLKANNDKVELTDEVNRQAKYNKELLEKLQKTELHLQTLTDAIEIKDRELFNLQEKLSKLENPVLECDHHNHDHDHDHDHETHDHVVNDTVELKKEKQATEPTNYISTDMDKDNLKKLDVGLIEETANEQTKIVGNYDNTDYENQKNILDKEAAMRYLEEKFKRTMQEIADLMEEKQKLEHLVIQLQGETETIGEYIALYQQQRMVLKQKCVERDEQLKQLTHDREQIKIKLERLIELIRKLALGRDTDYDEQNMQLNTSDDTKNIYSKFVEEILTLLSEIKSSNLIDPDENIHCSWCSGRLINV